MFVSWRCFLLFPALVSTNGLMACPHGQLMVSGATGPSGCIDPATATLTSVSASETVLSNISTQLAQGCYCNGAPEVVSGGPTIVTIARHLICPPSRYHTEVLDATVIDTWTVGADNAVQWNTTVSSQATRYWTTEVVDTFIVPNPSVHARVWAGATNGSRLEPGWRGMGRSSLEPSYLSDFKGRVYYGRDQWSANGRGTVMLCSELSATCPRTETHGGAVWTSSLPLVSVLDRGIGLSVVGSPVESPPNAFLDVPIAGNFRWTRQWHRLGNHSAPVRLSRHVVLHAECWRPAVGFMVRLYSEAFSVHPNVNISLVDGAGAYADYRGEQDARPFSAALGDYATRLQEMNFQTNWEPTANFGESHGTWMPFNLSTGALFENGWTSCMGTPNFTKAFDDPNCKRGQAFDRSCYVYPTTCFHMDYSTLKGWFTDLASFGFSTMMYGNYWEFGWSCDGGNATDCMKGFGMPDGIRTDTPLQQCDPLPQCDPRSTHQTVEQQRQCKLRLLCDTQLYLRKHLIGSVLRRWTNKAGVDSGSVIKTGMEGSVILDCGFPEYQDHLMKMARLMIEQIPESAGIAFDGTGWQGRLNLDGDDGVTYVELHEVGETGGPFTRVGPVHAQVTSKIRIQKVIGDILHAAGKAHFWNPYPPRADFLQHTDGVFAEDSYEDERMHLLGLLGIGGKPIISWNPGCEARPSSQCGRYKQSYNNAELLQRLLYWGVQPMVPFERNDHAITRWQAQAGNDTDIFSTYGPLFRALRGRSWIFSPNAIYILPNRSTSGAITNMFYTPLGYIAYVGLASPHSTVVVEVSAIPTHWQAPRFDILKPTGQDDTSVELVRPSSKSIQLELTFGRGTCAMVRILPPQGLATYV